jgi:outer membrane protein assembly factor BamB
LFGLTSAIRAPRLTQVSDFINFPVVHGPDVYYASTPAGHVGRVDLRTGRTLWVRSVPVGVQSPVLVDGRVVVTSPATSQVIELSAADGRVLARRTVPGTAYGVAAVGRTLYVTLARKSAVAELDADTLAPMATAPVPDGPRAI